MDTVEDIIGVKGSEVLCLDIREPSTHGRWVSGLVLVHVDGREGVYRRVRLSTIKPVHFEGADMMDLTIICGEILYKYIAKR